MVDLQANNENDEIYEFNGYIDDIICEIQDYFDYKIPENEAKFIAYVLAEKQQADCKELKSKEGEKEDNLRTEPEEVYTDAGYNTQLGYFVLQTSKLKIEAIHLLFTFFLSYLVSADPINCLATLGIQSIWAMVNSVKLIKEDDDKIVMSIIIEINSKKKKGPISLSEISKTLNKRYSDSDIDFDDKRIRDSLDNLVRAKVIDYSGGCWQICQ